MRYVICIDNCEYPVSLELRQVYQVVDDADAEADGLLWVIDESREDYLFDASSFLPIELSQATQDTLAKAPA